MKKYLRKISRYLKLYRLFVGNCLMAQMEYRFNFLISVFVEVAFLFMKMLYVMVVFGTGADINGMSPYQVLMCIGLYTIITGIMDAVYFPNIDRLPELIRTGDLDFYITKPCSLQFLVSFRNFDLGLAVPNVIGGGIMVTVAWQKMNLSLQPGILLGFAFFSLIGVIITYPILMIPTLLSFWVVKTDQLFSILWSIWDFNNMPMGIYNRVIKRIGTFLIPVFVITNFAPLYAMRQLSVFYMIWSVVATVGLLFLLKRIFYYAVRHYSSASS